MHEAYLRLEKQGTAQFKNREHFLAVCAQLMRQILVDYARNRKATKREGGYRLTLDDSLYIVSLHAQLPALEAAHFNSFISSRT